MSALDRAAAANRSEDVQRRIVARKARAALHEGPESAVTDRREQAVPPSRK